MKTIIHNQATSITKSVAVTARKFVSHDEGQGISEYLIILAVVVIAAITLATTFSTELTALWNSITSQLSAIA